jgi:hypothetical protein
MLIASRDVAFDRLAVIVPPVLSALEQFVYHNEHVAPACAAGDALGLQNSIALNQLLPALSVTDVTIPSSPVVVALLSPATMATPKSPTAMLVVAVVSAMDA